MRDPPAVNLGSLVPLAWRPTPREQQEQCAWLYGDRKAKREGSILSGKGVNKYNYNLIQKTESAESIYLVSARNHVEYPCKPENFNATYFKTLMSDGPYMRNDENFSVVQMDNKTTFIGVMLFSCGIMLLGWLVSENIKY